MNWAAEKHERPQLHTILARQHRYAAAVAVRDKVGFLNVMRGHGKPILQVVGRHGPVGVAVTSGPLERILPGVEVGPDAVVAKVIIVIAAGAPPRFVSCEGAVDEQGCVRGSTGLPARKRLSIFRRSGWPGDKRRSAARAKSRTVASLLAAPFSMISRSRAGSEET